MIHWPKVLELRSEVGAEDFDEVVELFLDEVEDTISNLGAPGRSLEHDLHFLKGSALNAGLAGFSTLCAQGEQAMKADPNAPVDQNRLQNSYAESCAALLAAIPPNP